RMLPGLWRIAFSESRRDMLPARLASTFLLRSDRNGLQSRQRFHPDASRGTSKHPLLESIPEVKSRAADSRRYRSWPQYFSPEIRDPRIPTRPASRQTAAPVPPTFQPSKLQIHRRRNAPQRLNAYNSFPEFAQPAVKQDRLRGGRKNRLQI